MGPRGCPHLLALGRRWVEAVVGQVASEDTQLTGDDPPGLAQLHVAPGREEGPEVAGGKHGARRGCRRPVAEAGQGQAGDLGQGDRQRSGALRTSQAAWRSPRALSQPTNPGNRGPGRRLLWSGRGERGWYRPARAEAHFASPAPSLRSSAPVAPRVQPRPDTSCEDTESRQQEGPPRTGTSSSRSQNPGPTSLLCLSQQTNPRCPHPALGFLSPSTCPAFCSLSSPSKTPPCSQRPG